MADTTRVGTQTVNYNESPNEITLYKDNQPILKAECGVTLGLLKLIYSSDNTYRGVLLGVKPRLSNRELPCLVTFDSTSLTHPEYDLIVQAVPAAEHIQREQVCEVTQRQLSTERISLSYDISHKRNASTQPVNAQSIPSSLQIQRGDSSDKTVGDLGPSSGSHNEYRGHDQWTSPSSTNLSLGQEPKPSEQRCPLPSLQGNVPSEKITNINCEFNDPPDSTVQENDVTRFVLSAETMSHPSVADGHKVDETRETQAEPSCGKAPVEIQFNPEEFNFDIGSVVPFHSDKGTRWPCDRCSKDFCSSSHLKRHWILHTDFKPYKCEVCNKCFPFHWDLKRHMTKHSGDKPFKCPLCPKSFNSQKELQDHNWLHTGKKEYQCHVCHHEFSSHGNLKIHMRKHTGEKPYKCEYCPKSFHMLGHYQYHVRQHTGEKPYRCDICGKTFSYSHNLNEHKNMHTGYRPYSCSQCAKKFTHRSTFKQHVLMHEGSKLYKCHVCSKAFVQSSNYRRHILTHKTKEERIQKCDLCGRELLSRRGFKNHRKRCVRMLVERANANEPKPKKPRLKSGEFHCEHCPRVSTYSRWLETHVARKHTLPSAEDSALQSLKPTKAKDKRPRKANLKAPEVPANPRKNPRQAPVLPIQCSDCGRRFGYTERLKEHQAKVHQQTAVQGTSSPTATQASVSHTTTAGKYVFIVPKPTDNNSTGSPASAVPQETPLHSQPASEQMGNRFLQSDGTDKQDARETGFEALSALGRLSAKIGMEGNLVDQSIST